MYHCSRLPWLITMSAILQDGVEQKMQGWPPPIS